MKLLPSKKQSVASVIVSLLGLILLLIGTYGAVRTMVNMKFFDKYPTTGIYNMYGYEEREEDCEYPMTYTTPEGQPREKTDEERDAELKQKEICLSRVAASRENTQVNDVSLSLLFLFLGGGVLLTKKYFV